MTSRDRITRAAYRAGRRPVGRGARADFEDALTEVSAAAAELSDDDAEAFLEDCIESCAQIVGIVPGHPLWAEVFPGRRAHPDQS